MAHIDNFSQDKGGVESTAINEVISYNGTTSGNENNVLPGGYRGIIIGFFKAGTYKLSFHFISGSYTIASGGADALYLKRAKTVDGTATQMWSGTGLSKLANSGTLDINLNEDNYLILQHYINKAGYVLNNFKYCIQIERGSTATSYEPYKSKTQLLSLGSTVLQPNQAIQKYNGQWCIDTTPITDTTLKGQLENFEDEEMYKGTTNMFITTTNDAPIIEATYHKDLGTLVHDIDTRLELLETE